jgi:hypothetical protein
MDHVVVATNDESTPPPPSHSLSGWNGIYWILSLAARKQVPQQQHRWLGSNYLDNDIHSWTLAHWQTWRTYYAGGTVKGLLGYWQHSHGLGRPAVVERRGAGGLAPPNLPIPSIIHPLN